jgi:tRNA(His) guanylyltransferase
MKNKKDSLGDRMKSYYESRFRFMLQRRTNFIIRIDGKAFHTYTRGLEKPFDGGLMRDMAETTRFLCENIQGAKFGYTQSDEISILVTDYDDLSTSAWFDNNLQKMCSISASLTTAKFNQLRVQRAYRNIETDPMEHGLTAYDMCISEALNTKLAMFDSRIFAITEPEEVVNYFIWRQQDATRNSVSMAAQSMFSHKQLQGESGSSMQEMMHEEKGVNWNDYPTICKRGTSVWKKTTFLTDTKDETYMRSNWVIDTEMPILTQDRNYILNRLPKIELV